MNFKNRVNKLEKQCELKNSNYSKKWSDDEMMNWCKQCAHLFGYTPEEYYDSLKNDNNTKPLIQILEEYQDILNRIEAVALKEKMR